jgi:hypothetical protein
MWFTKIKAENHQYVEDKFSPKDSGDITIGTDDNELYVNHDGDIYHHETIKGELKRYLDIYVKGYSSKTLSTTQWNMVFRAQRPEDLFRDIKEEP